MKSRKTRVVLGSMAACGLALAAAWECHAQFIAPLKRLETETLRGIEKSTARLKRDRETIAKSQAQEAETDRIRRELDRLQAELPEGSAMVWLPGLMKEHFTRLGLAAPTVSLNSTQRDRAIPSHVRGFWFVGLPIENTGRKTWSLLHAAAELEQRNPFLRVLDFTIRADSEDSTRQQVVINVALLFPKAETPR